MYEVDDDGPTITRLRKLSELIKGKRILDVGCRKGILRSFLPKTMEYYGLEVGNSKNKNIVKLPKGIYDESIENIFGDIKFDTVVLAETLEHLHDPVGALLIIKKLLKKGGRLVGSVPNSLSWRYFFSLKFLKNLRRKISGQRRLGQ